MADRFALSGLTRHREVIACLLIIIVQSIREGCFLTQDLRTFSLHSKKVSFYADTAKFNCIQSRIAEPMFLVLFFF